MSTLKELSAALDALVNGTLSADQFVDTPVVVKYSNECRRALEEKRLTANPVARIRMSSALTRLKAHSRTAKSMSDVAADFWAGRTAQADAKTTTDANAVTEHWKTRVTGSADRSKPNSQKDSE